ERKPRRPGKASVPVAGDVRIVVVVDVVVAPDLTRARARRPLLGARTVSVLRRRIVVVVLRVRRDAGLVVVELGVLDDEVAAGVQSCALPFPLPGTFGLLLSWM